MNLGRNEGVAADGVLKIEEAIKAAWAGKLDRHDEAAPQRSREAWHLGAGNRRKHGSVCADGERVLDR